MFPRELEAINSRRTAEVEVPRRSPPSAPAVNGEGAPQLPLDVDCGRGVSRRGSPLRRRMAGGGGANGVAEIAPLQRERVHGLRLRGELGVLS